MGTGTEYGNWNALLNINGVQTSRKIYQVLKESRIPTRLEKTYLNSTVSMTHAQELLNNGISPVWLEENKIEDIYKVVYPTGNAWDTTHVWNDAIQAAADEYYNDVLVPRVANMKTLNFNGQNVYYVLNPEFVFVGDLKTSPQYRAFIDKEIDLIRSANLPNVKIIRGFLVNPSKFEDYLTTISDYAKVNQDMLAKVDYFGPEFHNQNDINAEVAARMITFLTTVKSYTGKQNFIPSSYIRWNTVYTGTDAPNGATGTDSDGAKFWDYLHAHRDELANNAGVAGWCLSASFEQRGGSGLVEPQIRPDNFTGYRYPFAANGTYNMGGVAFANWMRDESPYQFTSASSGKAAGAELASTSVGSSIVQLNKSTTSLNQRWVLIQLDSGAFKIRNKKSGYLMGVQGASTAPGALIKQATDVGQSDAQWSLIDAGNGRYKIQNKASGLLMTVQDNSTVEGASLIQDTDTGGTNQLWVLDY
jgi:hypothetical protein